MLTECAIPRFVLHSLNPLHGCVMFITEIAEEIRVYGFIPRTKEDIKVETDGVLHMVYTSVRRVLSF